jgi:hypothetical protein
LSTSAAPHFEHDSAAGAVLFASAISSSAPRVLRRYFFHNSIAWPVSSAQWKISNSPVALPQLFFEFADHG